MGQLTLFRGGAEWAPDEYMVFGIQPGPTQLTEFSNSIAKFGTDYTVWSVEPGPQVLPGPGAKPGATDPRRVLVQREEELKRRKLENNVRNALTIILTEYYF